MKKYVFILFLLASCTPGVNVEENSNEVISEETTTTKGETMNQKTYNQPHEMNIDTSKSYSATIKTNFGEIKIEFFTEDAPVTVNNFVTLAKDGYYDGVIFHRVVPGFVIQGGDPSGTGHGNGGMYPGYTFQDELNNPQPYLQGIVAMANAGPNTNGSQFFIVHQDINLNYAYTIFGKVTEGQDVVNNIATVPTSGERPLEDVVIESVEISES